VIAAAAGRVPVLAGVFDTGTAPAIAHAEVAARLGADALVLTAPFYVRPNQGEIATHFRAVRAAVDLPLIAYDIPSAGPTKPDRATILALAREGVIAGIKDISGDEGNFRLLLAEFRAIPSFTAFTGSELLVDQALLAGASGAVPGLANVDPADFVRIYDAVQAGKVEVARTEQERLGRIFAIIQAATPGRMGFSAAAFGGFKTALMLRGVIDTNVMGRPLGRYNAGETARVGAILASVDLLP